MTSIHPVEILVLLSNDEAGSIQPRITCLTVAPPLSLLNTTSDNYSPTASVMLII